MSTYQSQESLEGRITNLEKQSRVLCRSRILNFVLLACLAGLAFLQYNGWDYVNGKTVSAEKFVVKDENGLTRAELGSENGVPNLALYDNNGNPRASLAITQGEPGFHIYDEQGFRRAVVGLNHDGPQIVFMDQSGVKRSGLVWSNDGQIEFYVAEGETESEPIPLYKAVNMQQVY